MTYGTVPNTDAGSPPVRQRTVLVWVILAFIAFGVIITPFTLWTLHSVYVRVPVTMYLGLTINLVVNIAAAIALFNLRASAIRYFALALVVALVHGIYHATSLEESHLVIPIGVDAAEYLSSLWAGQIVGVATSILTFAAILLYMVWLRRRGILR